MDYNTKRSQLIIPEYGRNIQKMVEYALTIEDRDKRTAYANLIVTAMCGVNPEAKNIVDYKHKLWDHLYIISNYKLDVDSPYPMPDREKRLAPPEPLNYKDNNIKYGTYGSLIEKMIEEVIKMEDGEEKQAIIALIAQQLKKFYLQYNRDSVDDDLILKHFEELSKGLLKLNEDFKLNTTKNILSKNNKKKTNNNNKHQQNNNINKKYSNNSPNRQSK
ncbi:MAG: DUF4290 domain-containing protein [Bacteroidales bacterium]|jgi:hypothetical protein|nr:DUF4290 domain-containing protein [Bacteroidales bacterium]